MLEVLLRGQTALGQEGHALFDQAPELALVEAQDAAFAGSLGNAAHDLVHELRQAGLHLVARQVRLDESHAAVDVEADPSRRDHAVAVVHGGDAADGKAVAPVDVGHGDARLEDAGQGGHVPDLLQRLVGAGLGEELLARIDDAGHAHVALGRQQVGERSYLLVLDHRASP